MLRNDLCCCECIATPGGFSCRQIVVIGHNPGDHATLKHTAVAHPQINDEASEKILEIEREYNRKRRPKYESRSKLLRSIPKFWQRVLSNSAIVSSLLTEDDIKALEYLEEVRR